MTNADATSEVESVFIVPAGVDPVSLFGVADANIRALKDRFAARITSRGDRVLLCGEDVEVELLKALLSELSKRVLDGLHVDEAEIDRTLLLMKHGEYSPQSLRNDVLLSHRGNAIRPKTAGQKRYVDAIRNNTIVFGIGPAGTGKTYLAMAMAVSALSKKEVSRIILTRPAVEAGESLGYLPGSLTEKVDPYIRPLYDALFDMMDMERASALIDSGVIEIAPLAFMRGRTLNDSFVILDEAQNTTSDQMKMFLTRLGFNSKMVVTGDVTQLDLPKGISGLKSVRNVLKGIDDIEFCELDGKDIVRHGLVAKIVRAYEESSG